MIRQAGLALAGLVFLATLAPAFAGPPRTIFIPPNNYPEGVRPGPDRLRVQVRYELGDDGRFTLCEVQSTSGQAEIDAASCDLLRKRARFRPEPDTRRGRLTHARNMTDASWQDDVSDERLFNSISNGRGKMPAFRKKISENDIDALVAYVRRLRR